MKKVGAGDIVKATGMFDRKAGEIGVVLDVEYGDYPEAEVVFEDGGEVWHVQPEFDIILYQPRCSHGDKVYHDRREKWLCPWCEL